MNSSDMQIEAQEEQTKMQNSESDPFDKYLDDLGFVRNVNINGTWKQLSLSTSEQEDLVEKLSAFHTTIFSENWDNAELILRKKTQKPTPRMIHDLSLAMFQRQAPHIHLVFSNYLEKKAKMEREKAVEEITLSEAQAIESKVMVE